MACKLTSRTAYRISLIAGIIVIAITVLGQVLKPVPVCGKLAPGYQPIIAFEMVRSVSDLHAIFGEAPDQCRTAITAQLNTINVVDCWLYIPAYGSFLAFFFLGMRSRERRLGTIAAATIVIACAADYAENFCLFQLSANPDVESHWITLLAWTTEMKWVGLGVASAIGGAIFWQASGWWRLAMAPCAAAVVAALIAIPHPAIAGPHLSLAFVAGWILFIAVDVRESFRQTIRPGN
jgi:hypothetical protein